MQNHVIIETIFIKMAREFEAVNIKLVALYAPAVRGFLIIRNQTEFKGRNAIC